MSSCRASAARQLSAINHESDLAVGPCLVHVGEGSQEPLEDALSKAPGAVPGETQALLARTCPEKLDRFEVEDFASCGLGPAPTKLDHF